MERLKFPLVQLCVKLWRIEGWILNAEGHKVKRKGAQSLYEENSLRTCHILYLVYQSEKMHQNRQQSTFIILSALIVVVMGFFFKYYTGLGHQWFNDYGAAVFYEIFWCLFAFWFIRSQRAVTQIPIWVFIITCILEFLQLWHPPVLKVIRATLIGKWLLGTTFVWWDFPHYLLGCALGWLWLRQLKGISNAKKSKGET